MRLRVRTADGAQSVVNVDDACTVSALKRAIHDSTGIDAREQRWRIGFPARVIDVADDDASCVSLGVQSGETIAVTRDETRGATTVDARAAKASGTSTFATMAEMDEDEAFARALALSMGDDATTSTTTLAAQKGGAMRLEDMFVVRRVIESDNSCLFNAVAYAAEKSLREATRLRKVIVDAIRAEPATFDAAFLGKPPSEYTEWISRPNSWGGQVELYILSKHYGVEIAAYDIQTERCDVYGEDQGHPDRIMVIYDGLHYDALVLNPSSIGADVSLDVSRVPPAAALEKIPAFIRAQHDAKSFTDTANFTLRCLVCQRGLVGQSEAVKHAKETGHANFGEY